MENTSMVVVVVGALAIYFFPTCIAGFRNHHQQYAILALNLFLGWTFVGWVIAFVWALTAINKDQQPSKAPKAPKTHKAPPGWPKPPKAPPGW